MTLVWKENKIELTPGQAFAQDTLSMERQKASLEIDLSEPVRKYVDRGEKWCDRYNPESFGRVKRLDNFAKLRCFKITRDAANQLLDKQEKFTMKELMALIDENGLSDGGKQRNILGFLCCIGVFKKVLITHNKEGKELKKPRYEFYRGDIDRCEYLSEGCCCNFDWKNAEITFLYG